MEELEKELDVVDSDGSIPLEQSQKNQTENSPTSPQNCDAVLNHCEKDTKKRLQREQSIDVSPISPLFSWLSGTPASWGCFRGRDGKRELRERCPGGTRLRRATVRSPAARRDPHVPWHQEVGWRILPSPSTPARRGHLDVPVPPEPPALPPHGAAQISSSFRQGRLGTCGDIACGGVHHPASGGDSCQGHKTAFFLARCLHVC
uniref:Uncharacterized protein n=1 Tax=Anas platyrhynchos platyrhynchos TaxID=8840 RepID=A0A493TYE2_ANAPP